MKLKTYDLLEYIPLPDLIDYFSKDMNFLKDSFEFL